MGGLQGEKQGQGFRDWGKAGRLWGGRGSARMTSVVQLVQEEAGGPLRLLPLLLPPAAAEPHAVLAARARVDVRDCGGPAGEDRSRAGMVEGVDLESWPCTPYLALTHQRSPPSAAAAQACCLPQTWEPWPCTPRPCTYSPAVSPLSCSLAGLLLAPGRVPADYACCLPPDLGHPAMNARPALTD